MIEVCSLSSGSNGNAFFIKTGDDCFLVDAGISCRQICTRLQQVNSHIDQIKGIFITHEHTDHIQGLSVLCAKFPIPIYITEKTYNRSNAMIDKRNLRFIEPEQLVMIGDTMIKVLPKSHDAIEPTLFSFYYRSKKISVVTDAGYPCSNVLEAVKDAHVLFLESNYDDEMLKNGIYPPFLKQRVAGKRGHLSNLMAAETILNHASPDLEYVFLSHLSENNNTPDLALNTFKSKIKVRKELEHLQSQTFIASRREVSRMIKLNAEAVHRKLPFQ